jgi:hypothetical protein
MLPPRADHASLTLLEQGWAMCHRPRARRSPGMSKRGWLRA